METIGTYQILRKLAHGGMAEIFLACPEGASSDDKPVVIKRILPELAHDTRFLAMFLNEAQLAAHMHHPGIVRVMEFGEDRGCVFMVMEYVEGMDCWRFAKRCGSWGEDHIGLAVFVVRCVLDALQYAHNMRDVNGDLLHVVHRDLSPSNIYLSRDGSVKVGDFGIARVDSERFRPVKIVPRGKFGYMAPEQVEGMPVDRRADIYSTGVVLSELLIREQLFTGTSHLSIMLDIRDGRLEKLEKNAEKIPEGIRQILEGALARNPSDRYRTAGEFSEALAAYEQHLTRRIDVDVLGEWVRRAAQQTVSGSGYPSDVDAIAAGMAGDEIVGLQVTGVDGITAVDVVRAVADEGTPITMEAEMQTGQGSYWLRLQDGSIVGPTSFAHVVELVYSDRVGPDTLVSRDGRQYQQAADCPELVRHLPVYTPLTENSDVSSLTRRGVLDVDPLCSVLLAMVAGGDTGLLICERKGRRKEVYVREGVVVYVGSNESGELLGEYLVEHQVLERAQLEMALALLPKFHGHLGDTLIALGMMTAAELSDLIGRQIRHRLSDLSMWNEGNYEFYEGVEVRRGVLEVKIDLVRIVRDVLLTRVEAVDGIRVLQDLSTASVSPGSLLSRMTERLQLPPKWDAPLCCLQQWTPVAHLQALCRGTADEVGKTLFLGVESGLWACDALVIPWRTRSA